MLRTDSWTDDKGHTFKEVVDFRPFELEVESVGGEVGGVFK